MHGNMRSGYKNPLKGQKRPPEKSRRRWGDNIKLHVRKTVRKGVDWIHPAQSSEEQRDLISRLTNLRVL
jgi:hypothetical protein